MSIDDSTIRLARQLRIKVDSDTGEAVRVIVQSWARAWDEIHDVWAEAMMDLAAASKDGAWPTAWQVSASQRATAALAAATDQVIDLANLTGVTVVDAVGKTVAAVDPLLAEILASQVPAANRVALTAAFNRVDPLSLSWIVQRSTQQITSLTQAIPYAAQEQMRRVLIKGVAVGDNPRKAASEMVRRSEGAFNGGLTRALVIARTEIPDAHREASRGWRVANADVCDGWVWLTQLDKRTCPSCLAMNGTEHDIAEQGPNDHQQGRCTAVPKAKTWRELGIDLPEPESIFPDAQAWFNDLPQADKVSIMGPDRLKALDAGAPWADLAQSRSTPGWRDSWAPTPARDLLAKVA